MLTQKFAFNEMEFQIDDVESIFSLVSMIILFQKSKYSCPLSIVLAFEKHLRENLFRIPPIAPLLSADSLLFCVLGILGTSVLHKAEIEQGDVLCWDLNMRSVLIRCQELAVSCSSEESIEYKKQKLLLEVARGFILKHSQDFATHNPWITVVDEHLSKLPRLPGDTLDADCQFGDLKITRIARISARMVISHFF